MAGKKPFVILCLVAAVALGAPWWAAHDPQPQTPAQAAAAQTALLAAIPPAAPLSLITEPDDGMSAVTQAIEQASSSVDLVIYELEDPAIENALIAARDRGVAVRVILQNVNTFGRHPNQPAYDLLVAHKVPVIWAQKYFALTHQKTLVTDKDRALIMTFNLSPQYYASSRDFCVVDPDPSDVSAIEAAFDSDWKGTELQAPPGRDLIWSPGSADALLGLIGGAQKSLDIYNEEMADPRITQALEEAAARGVVVRVVMSYATNWKAVFTELVQAGVGVRTYSSTGTFYIHAKAVVADQERAFVGSENFSAQSLDNNRELGILIARPDILASLESTFNHDWARARPFVPAAAKQQ